MALLLLLPFFHFLQQISVALVTANCYKPISCAKMEGKNTISQVELVTMVALLFVLYKLWNPRQFLSWWFFSLELLPDQLDQKCYVNFKIGNCPLLLSDLLLNNQFWKENYSCKHRNCNLSRNSKYRRAVCWLT